MQQRRSSDGNEASQKSPWSPAKSKVLVWHGRRKCGGDRFQKIQVGPLRLHLLLGKYRKMLERIKQKLMGRFPMTDMGDVSLALGMEITRDRTKGTVIITQVNYVKSLLERYKMGNCNPAYTPGAAK